MKGVGREWERQNLTCVAPMKPRIFLGSSGGPGEAAAGAEPGASGHRRRRPVDVGLQSRRLDARTPRRAHARGRFRRIRLRPGRLDREGSVARPAAGQASPRDNVVFEAGLFGGALGIRRTFILHANGAKLPTDLLGLTSIRYDPDTIAGRRTRDQPEAPEGDRSRGPDQPPGRRLVATVPHGQNGARAVRRLAPDDQPRSRRRARGRRPVLAGRRHPVRALLERGVEGATSIRLASSTSGRRAPATPECPAARGDRRDQARER